MSLHNFINPTNENLVDIAENDDLSEIISFHLSQDIETAESDHEEGDLQPPVQPPSLKQALDGLRTLLLYQEYQKDAQHGDIQHLEQLERRLVYQQVASRTQRTLDSWVR